MLALYNDGKSFASRSALRCELVQPRSRQPWDFLADRFAKYMTVHAVGGTTSTPEERQQYKDKNPVAGAWEAAVRRVKPRQAVRRLKPRQMFRELRHRFRSARRPQLEPGLL